MSPTDIANVTGVLTRHGINNRAGREPGTVEALELWIKLPPPGCEGPVQQGETWVEIESLAHAYAWLGY